MTLEQSRKIAFILKGLTSVLDKNLKFLLTLCFFLKKKALINYLIMFDIENKAL